VDPILQLASSWRRGYAAKQLAEALRHWGEREPSLRRFGGEPERLFAFLRSEPSAERDAVFCALLRLAKCEQLAGLVLLEALLPGLKGSLGRTLIAAGEGDELLALMLANAWKLIVGYPVERRPSRVAANLLLDIRKQTLRQLPRQRRNPREQPRTCEPAASGRLPGSDLELPLRRAVAAGALSEAEAELILGTRIDGASLPKLAAEQGLAYITLYKRRARAERRLLLFLGRPVKNGSPKRHMCTARTDAADAAE
jgi:DNA-directed RNA polymerase specialized sigma24 family protein